MAIRFKKKVFKIGASGGITLPQIWLSYYGSRADEITLMGGSVLLVVPRGLELQAGEASGKTHGGHTLATTGQHRSI